MGDDPQAEPHYTKTYVATDSDLTVLLYNFDVGAARLKPAHQQYLKTNLPQYLSLETTATIVGLASPTGPDGFNFDLSRWRAEAVQAFIQSFDTPGYFLPVTSLHVGEEAARIAGLKDGAEDGRWRGVLLQVHKPAPTLYYDRLWIYDASIQEFRDMVTANDRPNTYMIPAQAPKSGGSGVIFLTEWLDILVANKTTFGSIVFITHGKSGLIRIDGDDMGVRSLSLYFQGKGYDKLFRTSGRVYFAGCNCAEGDDGWEFLEAAGNVFLRTGGGQAFGWTSLGFAVPSFFRPSGGHAVHLWGDVRSANCDFHGNLIGRFENGVKQ
jgi:hypothetical protein